MSFRNKVVQIVNKTIPYTAQYYGKVGDKPNKLRPAMNVVKNLNINNLIGAEIGIAQGVNAKKMLDMMSIKKLYLVDPYEPYAETDMDMITRHRREAHKRLEGYQNIVWIENTSEWASKDINEELDFVYIDARHDYENVLLDCNLWYPKVKIGGILCGHDFIGVHLGLRKAVKEFAKEKKVKLHIKPDDWWIVK